MLTEFLGWLEARKMDVFAQGTLGRAVNGCLEPWPNGTAVLEDGNLELDNNAAQGALRPLVTGRKTGLVANTPRGARANQVVDGLVATAKENGVDPPRYLEYVLSQLLNMAPDDKLGIEDLLPWSDALPEAVRARA